MAKEEDAARMAYIGTARSVSGEMMTAGHMLGRGKAEPADIIDADYVEVLAEPRQVRADPAPPPMPDRAGMAMLDRREAPVRFRGAARGGPLFWLVGGLAVIAAFWISGGHSMVRSDLALMTAANEPDLQIFDVRSRTESVEGSDALLVDGQIRNDGQSAGQVPALAVHVVSQAGETTVYRLGTLRTPLAPGAKYSFSGRLDMPKDGVKTVSVTFDQ